jgi:hypothetical protein
MTIHRDFDALLRAEFRAQPVAPYKGKILYKVPVKIRFNSSRQCATLAVKVVTVIATSAAAAADYVRDELGDRPETEITAYGPRGGRVDRYIGHHSAIAHRLFANSGAGRTLSLNLEI